MSDPDLDAIDYFRGESLVDDPYPYYDHLRAECPVKREPHHDVVMVTGYEEALGIYADAKTFSSCNAPSGPFAGFPVALEGDDVGDLIDAYRDQLPVSTEIMTFDPPKHTAHRALVMRLFTPRGMAELEPFIGERADRLIDGFADRGECEFISAFAAPFTVLVVCGLLGVPESDHESLLEDVLGAHRDRGLGNTRVATPNDPFSFLHARFTGYIEERRTNPRDDVMTRVATTPFPDGTMPEVIDVVRMASLLFGAGTGTTTHFLAAALQLLGERPDVQQLLRDEPERIPNFVEEMLRMESPIKGTFRLSRTPKTVTGVEIPAGTTVMLVNSGANRDPRQFECPNEFRVDRENARQNLTFGHGIHLCAGAALARAEARVAIERLLDRLPAITISESVHGPVDARRYEYTPSYQARALRNLDLEFAPAGT